VESFEISSFTRPSGGVFEVKFAKIQKMKKGSVEVYPEISHVCENFFLTLQTCENVG